MPDLNTAAIQRSIRQVESAVDRVAIDLRNVGGEVASVGAAQQRTRDELAQLRAEVLSFISASEQRDNVQRSETRIVGLNDQLDHEFGHHQKVRRSATGLLQAFDIGLVSEDTVRTVTEQLMIDSARYWLAPALVGLAAWSADDQALCEKAVQEAARRSPGRTALFFALVLRRQQRLDGSSQWLRQYLAAQDPHALTREFAVILEVVAQGGFGPAGRAAVQDTLDRWTEVLDDPARNAEQVARWRAEVERFRGGPSAGRFPALSSVSPQWGQLDVALAGAEGHRALLHHYEGLMAADVPRQQRLEDALDDILDVLVTEFDDEELPIRQQLAFHEAVVNRNGDLAMAQADAALVAKAFEETKDYLTVQTYSALEPDMIGVSKATQKIAVASCHAWFAQAHEQVTSAYRFQLPGDIEVAFGGTHNLGASAFQLPDWRGSLSAGVPALEASLAQHWDRHTDPYIERLAFPLGKKLIAPTLVGLLVLVLFVGANPLVGVVGGLLVGGIWGLKVYKQYEASLKAQEQAREMLARWKHESIQQLRGAGAEVVDWGSAFGAADAQADTARAFIHGLSTQTHGGTPFEKRTLVTGGNR